MESSIVDAPTAPPVKVPGHQALRLFKYSTWVHVGPGAEECVEGEQGTCSDPLHFHAWCRLPNQFQARDIRDKALAAKARRMRQLRDPDTDGYTILEEDLERLARGGDSSREELIAELILKDWWERFFEAQRDVAQDEDDTEEGKLIWEHIDSDRERWEALEAMPEAERPADEHLELSKRLTVYHEAVTKRFEELQIPEREALESLDISTLIDQVREQRIEEDSREEFKSTYATWLWLACTLRHPSAGCVWESLSVMRAAADEALTAIAAAFEDLEKAEREGSQGN